tara:strand:+ start:7473 stop:7697 length:225 start_codon:yes stop_codon:yes gene_type:complete
MWKKHDAINNPQCPVKAETRVIAQLSDGYILSPMMACEMDWRDVGDNIIRYRVPQTDISALQSLLEVKPAKSTV